MVHQKPLTSSKNRALVHFRQLHGAKPTKDLANAAVHWIGSLRDMRIVGAYSVVEEDHARRVLQRLVAQSED